MAKALTALNLLYRGILRGDDAASLAFLKGVGRIVHPAYRFHEPPELDLTRDDAFHRFLEHFGDLCWERRWMVAQLLRLTHGLPGDTVECGVFQGATSWIICSSNRSNGRLHHVFDSFEGLSEPNAEDGNHWAQGDFKCTEEEVTRNLSEFERVRFHRGWIPDRFEEVERERFAFVHVDVDLYEPTRDSIAFFYPRVVEGGIIVCDDYGHASCPGATRAIDNFLRDKVEKMLSLPSGGGFFVKGKPTDATACMKAG